MEIHQLLIRGNPVDAIMEEAKSDILDDLASYVARVRIKELMPELIKAMGDYEAKHSKYEAEAQKHKQIVAELNAELKSLQKEYNHMTSRERDAEGVKLMDRYNLQMGKLNTHRANLGIAEHEANMAERKYKTHRRLYRQLEAAEFVDNQTIDLLP